MKELSNSPSTPTSRNAPRANSHDGMDQEPIHRPDLGRPVDASHTGPATSSPRCLRLALSRLRRRPNRAHYGTPSFTPAELDRLRANPKPPRTNRSQYPAARPVAVVAAHLGLTDGLVEACARAEYERFARAVAGANGWPLPAWDDELAWRRSTFQRAARLDAMRARLEVLWPVIVEHLTTEER